MPVNNSSDDDSRSNPTSYPATNPDRYPALKPGVNLIRSPDHIYVGLLHRGLEISSSELELLALATSLLDGRRSLAQICEVLISQTGIESTQLCEELIAVLASANLLELVNNPVTNYKNSNQGSPGSPGSPGTKTGLTAQNEINFAQRVKPEINLAAWYEVSGTEETRKMQTSNSVNSKIAMNSINSMNIVKDRANFKIDIYGKNRLAISLFTLLQATGFSQSKLIEAGSNSRQVTIDLICGLSLRNSDLGSLCADIFDELKRSAQLNFRSAPDTSLNPDLAVSTEVIPSQLLQRWMSEGTAHLGLGQLIQSSFQIGPFVKPGTTPCLRCLELWRSSTNPRYQNLEILNSIARPLEISASAVSAIAGIVVLQICEFAINQQSSLLGASVNIDLLKPLTPEFEYWKPNPECGCITIN